MGKENKAKILTIILITAIIMGISSITIYSSVCAPKFYDYFIDTGVKYLMDGKYEEAILAFNKAIEIEEKSTEARVYLAKGYVGNNEYDKSIEILKEAQKLDITNEELLKEILEILNEIDADIAYEFLDRFINEVGKDNLSKDINKILDSATQSPSTPVADPAPGTYIKPISIKLKLDEIKVGHSFYYTTDGNEPNKNAKKYRGKIDIDKSTTVKLIGYNKNKESTEVMTLDYIIDTNIVNDIKDILEESKDLLNKTQVGTNVGDTTEESKKGFKLVIDKVSDLLKKDLVNYEDASNMKIDIEKALKTFKDNIIEPTDKSKLQTTINKAQNLYNNSKEGSKENEYKIGSKKILQQAIDSAKEIYENILSKQDNIDKEVILLSNSISNFEKSKNKNLYDLKIKYINKIKELESRESKWEDLYLNGMSNAETGGYLGKIYEDYEILLNDMNTELKKYLNNNELNTLNQLKNKFVLEKKKAEGDIYKTLEEQGMGTWVVTGEPLIYISVINKHCYEVINTLMN